MTTTTRWWWVRHAPVVNPEGLIYGQMDLEADFSDRQRLETLANVLPDGAVWVTTTLRRARETADRLAAIATPDRDISEDDGLSEQDFGDWEGARWDDIPAEVSDAFWRDPVENRTPNGESFAEVVVRASETIHRLNTIHEGRDVVVVAHAGSIRAAIGHALGGTPRAGLSFRVNPLSLTRIDAVQREGDTWWRVCGVNLYGDPS